MMTSSLAIRSSMAISPSSGTSSVRRAEVLIFLQFRFDDRHDPRFPPGISIKSLMRSSNCVYSARLCPSHSGQLIKAQFADGVGRGIAEGITTTGEARLLRMYFDTDGFGFVAREPEGQQFDSPLSRLFDCDGYDEFIQIGQRDEISHQFWRALRPYATWNRVRRMMTSRRCSM